MQLKKTAPIEKPTRLLTAEGWRRRMLKKTPARTPKQPTK